MYYFSVCSVFKNEAHILEEWILHYLHHGVEHFYLVNDNSNDDYKVIIDKYSNYITLMHNDIVTKDVGRQGRIYEKYFRQHLEKTKWMASIDLDEFLYSPTSINIQNILHTYENYAQIRVDWLHFEVMNILFNLIRLLKVLQNELYMNQVNHITVIKRFTKHVH